MSLSDVVGNAPVVGRLEAALREGTLPHAVMLTGPDGVGKTTIAEAVATALLDGAAWPGGLNAHPDHWLEDSDSERVGIDRVRAGRGTPETGPSIQDFLSLRPYAGGSRIAVLARADRLTEQAADCLLKTLEEPPLGSHILLAAAHPERLPATVLSRCQLLACSPVGADRVASWLSTVHGVGEELARSAAHMSGGRPGRALALATLPGALDAEVEAVDALLAVAGGDRGAVLRAAERLAPVSTAEGRERALAQVAAWTGFVRDVACVAAGAPELAVWTSRRSALDRWAETLPGERIATMLARCIETSDQLAQYAVPRLCFEVLLLDIFTAVPSPPPVPPAPRQSGLAPAATPSSSRPTRPRRRA